LFGFLKGPVGIYTGKYMELKDDIISYFKNRGGFDMIQSGRHKIETEEQFKMSMEHCQSLKLDGLVVIGGDDSNTNACLLAEYFKKHGCSTCVVGCPKTIDGDLKNEFVEVSFGFDTACKTYSELIGNIMLDTVSSKKYYHFVRLMGRSASHIALECTLLTKPNWSYIGEEVEAKKMTLEQIVTHLADIVEKRAALGKNYGVVLVPEGLIEFICEMRVLISEINVILGKKLENPGQYEIDQLFEKVKEMLTPECAKLLAFLPKDIRDQLLLDRDPHGNVQVAKIETERLLLLMVETELKKRKQAGTYKGKFTAITHYYGYEGRCAFPSNFDCNYCYSLGVNAAVLIEKKQTGMMSCIRYLHKEPKEWMASGYPLVTMMITEVRKGKEVPVIEKALTKLNGELFKIFEANRDKWAIEDCYHPPGPIQFGFKCLTPFLVKAPTKEDLDEIEG
jgi:diphosphate--fructose-6-phosphate 1-phosphotransferase